MKILPAWKGGLSIVHVFVFFEQKISTKENTGNSWDIFNKFLDVQVQLHLPKKIGRLLHPRNLWLWCYLEIADAVKSSWGHSEQRGANPVTGLLTRRGDTDTLGELYVRTKAESLVSRLQERSTKDCWNPPGGRRGRDTLSLSAFRQSMALMMTWFQTSRLQNWEQINLCHSEPPRPWSLVTATLASPCKRLHLNSSLFKNQTSFLKRVQHKMEIPKLEVLEVFLGSEML